MCVDTASHKSRQLDFADILTNKIDWTKDEVAPKEVPADRVADRCRDRGGLAAAHPMTGGPDDIARENAHAAVDSRRSCDLRDALGSQRKRAQLTLRESRGRSRACRLRLPTAFCPARSTVEASDQNFVWGRKMVEPEIRRDLDPDVTARMVKGCAIHTGQDDKAST
jgi:hypothetical protein